VTRAAARPYALILWGLAALFLLRVLGQALVAAAGPAWLPPMAAWHSGLLPYPVLLASQVVILALQAWIALDVTRGHGRCARRRPPVGRALRWISYAYAGAMAGRYVLTVALRPERRWLGGTIPIVFRWVLAAYLFTLGRYHEDRAEEARP
jgi:hypothetical protein